MTIPLKHPWKTAIAVISATATLGMGLPAAALADASGTEAPAADVGLVTVEEPDVVTAQDEPSGGTAVDTSSDAPTVSPIEKASAGAPDETTQAEAQAETQSVASIGDTAYATLAAAVNAAGDGDVIDLLADTAETIGISKKTNLTIEGHGHTIAKASFDGDNDTVTLRGLTFTGGAIQTEVNGQRNDRITIEDNVYDVTGAASWAVIYVQKTTTGLTIRNNTFNVSAPITTGNSIQCIGFAYTADLKATDVTIAGNTLNAMGHPDIATPGGTYLVIGGGAATDGSYGITDLTIEDNAVNSAANAYAYGAWLRNVDTLTVRGNRFEGMIALGLTGGKDMAPTRHVTIEDNTSTSRAGIYVQDAAGPALADEGVTMGGNSGMTLPETYVVSVAASGAAGTDVSVWYTSLDKAVAAAESGATLTLRQDVTGPLTVPADKSLILDLNGHTLAGGAEPKTDAIVDHGSLTVKDAGADGTGGVAGTIIAGPGEDGSTGGTGKPTLIIESGTFDVDDWSTVADADVTITGGRFGTRPSQDFIRDDQTFIQGSDGYWTVGAASITQVEPVAITVESGEDPTPKLPQTVRVALDNGLSRDAAVTWGEVAETWKDYHGGEFTVVGAALDGVPDTRATAKVTVKHATIASVSVEPGTVETPAGIDPTDALPKTAVVRWSNGQSTEDVPVSWDADSFDEGDYAEAGASFTVKGVVTCEGYEGEVSVRVTVGAPVVMAVEPSGEAIEVDSARDDAPTPKVSGRVSVTWSDGSVTETEVPLELPEGWNHPRTEHTLSLSGRVDGWDGDVPFAVTVRAAKAESAADPEAIATLERVAPELPATVAVTWSNGESSQEPVVWDEPDADAYGTAGTTVRVTGEACGLPVALDVRVLAASIVGVDAPAMVVTESGVAPALPSTVTAHWNNGETTQATVSWDGLDSPEIAAANRAREGACYTLNGSVSGWDGVVEVAVSVNPAKPTGLAEGGTVKRTVTVGERPQLPETMPVRWSNGDVEDAAVVWDDYDAASVKRAGTFSVSGTVTVPADGSGAMPIDASDASDAGDDADAVGGSTATASFPVVAVVTVKAKGDAGSGTQRPGTHGSTAKTGVSVVWAVASGLVLLMCGAVCATLVRRRR